MRQETLRWGLTMGLIAAILGTVAFAIGALIAPLRLYTSAEAVAFAYFARGMLGFIALGIALGLAYYAGLRSERDVRRAGAAQPISGEAGMPTTQAAAKVPWGEQWNAANTGAIVMLCFWIAATACAYVFPLSQPGVPQPQNQALTNAELHLVLLVVYILFGAGAGGIGGRWYASRIVLDRIIVMPPSLPVAREVKPAEAATTGATAEHTEAATESAAEQGQITASTAAAEPAQATRDL
ncbi:MAG: hypothetical protein ACXWQZ_08475 [Ktedonobacterales bacterium]